MKVNKLFNLIVLAAIVATAISCSSESGETLRPPTAAEFNEMRTKALERITQTMMFNAEDGIDFTSDKGARFYLPASQIKLNGTLVTGPVKLEFVELYKNGNMLVVNKPLMGTAIDGTSKGPMITGGQFYINVTKDGNQIDEDYYSMTVPAENTEEPPNPDMTFWVGAENENDNMEWDEIDEQRGGVVWGEGNDYNLIGRFFCWINIDILYNLLGPKARVWIKVPQGYDNKNCAVYVVYKDQPGALAYMDVWDPTEKMFTEHYGLAPIGMNFYVVFVSVYEDHYVYAYKDVTVEDNQIITFTQSDLRGIDEESLIWLINNM